MTDAPTAAETLGSELGKATGLDEALSRSIIETAMAYIASRRPDVAERAERILVDKKRAAQTAARIASLAPHLDR